MSPARFVGTLGGVGLLRPAPGTWGSALVLPLALLGPLPCLALAAVFTVAGYWAAGEATRGDEDPGWFVADEGAGMLIALAALAEPSLPGVLAAFALFRAFDIVKPWPVSWADNQGGPFGIMADDVIAGALAGVLLMIGQAVLRGGA